MDNPGTPREIKTVLRGEGGGGGGGGAIDVISSVQQELTVYHKMQRII